MLTDLLSYKNWRNDWYFRVLNPSDNNGFVFKYW